MRYKVGDEVKFTKNLKDNNAHLLGRSGIVIIAEPAFEGDEFPYKTTIDPMYWFGESELELANPQPLQVKLKLLTDTAVIPRYATEGAACFDLVADEDIIVEPGCTVAVNTGLSFEIPMGYKLCIYARSGISAKTPLRIANAPAQIDSDYRGEVKVLLWNSKQREYIDMEPLKDHYLSLIDNSIKSENTKYNVGSYLIRKGDRIAQAEIVPVIQVDFEVVDKLSTTERGEGGFGSTGN